MLSGYRIAVINHVDVTFFYCQSSCSWVLLLMSLDTLTEDGGCVGVSRQQVLPRRK